jgi:hypothetical protein
MHIIVYIFQGYKINLTDKQDFGLTCHYRYSCSYALVSPIFPNRKLIPYQLVSLMFQLPIIFPSVDNNALKYQVGLHFRCLESNSLSLLVKLVAFVSQGINLAMFKISKISVRITA